MDQADLDPTDGPSRRLHQGRAEIFLPHSSQRWKDLGAMESRTPQGGERTSGDERGATRVVVRRGGTGGNRPPGSGALFQQCSVRRVASWSHRAGERDLSQKSQGEAWNSGPNSTLRNSGDCSAGLRPVNPTPALNFRVDA